VKNAKHSSHLTVSYGKGTDGS